MGIKEMPRLARFIPKIMLAITVTACDEVYRKIACWLNDMGETSPSVFPFIELFIHFYPDLTHPPHALVSRITDTHPIFFFSKKKKPDVVGENANLVYNIVSEYLACFFHSTENYRLQSAYEKNLIIKMVLVSDFL